ncbi:MAG: YfhO family protein [Candidatus Goldbacteria bacterium]|nr:YfhO family protein [Candidatus Goldiibacteriota bacterium]
MPFRELAAVSVQAGEIPLWNPYIFCGNPLMANMQSAVFYPLNVFYYLMPFDIAFKIQTMLSFFIAAFFMFKAVKIFGVSDKGAFLSGFLFAFSFYMTVRTVELADLHTIIWAPAAVYFSVRWLKKGMFHDLFFSSAALSLSFLGGHPQVFIYIYIIFAAFYIYESKNNIRQKPGMLAGFVLINLFMAGIIAAQLLPAAEFVLNSKRAGQGYTLAVVKNTYAGFEQMASFFFPFLSFKFGSESSFLNWMGSIDIGVVSVLLFVLAAVSMPDKKLKNFFMALFTVSLFLAFMGSMPFFDKLYEWVPFIKAMRYASKVNVILFFVLCFMAGFGFDAVFNREKGGLKGFTVFVNAFALTLVTVCVSAAVFKEPLLKLYMPVIMPAADFQAVYDLVESYNRLLNQIFLYTAFVCAFAAVIYVNREGMALKKYAPVILLLTACGAVFSYRTAGYDYFQKFEDVKSPTAAVNFLLNDPDIKNGKLRLLAPSETNVLKHARSFEDAKELLYYSKDKLSPNVPMSFGLYNSDGFDSLETASFAGLRSLVSASDKPWEAPAFSLFSIKYIAAIPKINGMHIKELFRGETGIYENANRVDRVYYVPLSAKIHYTDDNAEIYQGLQGLDFNPLKVLYLEEKARENNTAAAGQKSEKLNTVYKASGLNRLDIKLTAPGPGYAVINDAYYPGWTARVNGIKMPIYRANSAFKAVKVQGGENIIKLEFKPLIVSVSFILSVLSILLLTAAAFITFHKGGSR